MNAGIEFELWAAFQSSLRPGPGTEAHLRQAILQTLGHPGSLVRARLAYDVACAYRLSKVKAVDLAIAIEYFHTASLLFDDLPCMDNAIERRGVTCVHRVHGEAASVLAALALINRAYSLIWRSLAGASVKCQLQVGAFVEQNLGLNGMLNGQSEDLHYGTLPRDGRDPQRVAMGKTVSLIRLSLVIPAMLGGAATYEVRLLERLSVFWGLSYQILDDLKDLYQDPSQTGKTAARDESLNRPNLALTVGPELALIRVERLMRLGNKVMNRLLLRQPALVFLIRLRDRLRGEFDTLRVASAVPAP